MKYINLLIFLMVTFPVNCNPTGFDAQGDIKYSENEKAYIYETGSIRSKEGARKIESILQSAISSGKITEDELFDEDYKRIRGSVPKKFSTKFDKFFDESIRSILDSFLNEENVIYAVAFDSNGYLPTHNTKFIERAKRIFEDPVTQTLLNSNDDVVSTSYVGYDEKSNTNYEVVVFSSPIFVKNMRWGSFSIAFSKERQ